jgi:hypothetical protein
MNRLLPEGQHPVWALTAVAAKATTGQPLPDVEPTPADVARSIGPPVFGEPRMPLRLRLGEPAPPVPRAA